MWWRALWPTGPGFAPLSALAPGPIDANVVVWKLATTMEMIMYIGGILGTILIIALILFLVRRI
jgi:nitrate reductase gamma subunit